VSSARRLLFAGSLIPALLAALTPPATAQTIVYGPAARTAFEGFVLNNGDKFLDFNSLNPGLALDTELQISHGLIFASTIQTNGGPIVPPHNVYVTSTSVGGNATTKIVGTPFVGGSDDGRVGYEITFTTPQARAGLQRIWQAGNSVTRFYNQEGTLLATHFNTVGSEFVAYLADFGNTSTWVARIQMDGLVSGGSRQVGYSDDLFYGFSAIPEPGTWALLLTGLGAWAVAAQIGRASCRERV